MGAKDVTELLIANGADVNAKGAVGFTHCTPLYWTGDPEIVALLVSKGADVNVPVGGETPLHGAAWVKNRHGVSR